MKHAAPGVAVQRVATPMRMRPGQKRRALADELMPGRLIFRLTPRARMAPERV